jgi:serine/threonine protein phosphatase 1
MTALCDCGSGSDLEPMSARDITFEAQHMQGRVTVSKLPGQLRIYAIGDIHGRADLLASLLDMIKADAKAAPAPLMRLVFLGDYVDRGPDSHDVVALLLTGLPKDMPAEFLMGNHERMMLDAWADESRYPLWIANGGKTTQDSYIRASITSADGHEAASLKTEDLVPPRHWMFFERLKMMASHGDYLFVHAGIRPGVPLAAQTEHDLLWIREPFLSYRGDHGQMVVHGHTPVDVPEQRSNRIGIDTGAVFTGRLTALVLEGETRRFLMTGAAQ